MEAEGELLRFNRAAEAKRERARLLARERAKRARRFEKRAFSDQAPARGQQMRAGAIDCEVVEKEVER